MARRKTTGSIKRIAFELVTKKQAGAVGGLLRIAQNEANALPGNWETFVLAVWMWLWELREKTLFRVSVFGVTLFSRKVGDLQDILELGFGACPFDWEDGHHAPTIL